MKRSLDIFLSIIALVALSPLLLLIGILVRINLGGPVLFRQTRPGYHGNPFQLIKFRTMTDEKNSEGDLLPDRERLPRFGRFMRSTSLD
jgi:lipopolysaccharide/colanic/teichoic acid biosynthesis glycosyltransferase